MSSVAVQQRPAARITASTLALLGVAALVWAGLLAFTRDMGNGAGTMGMSFADFELMWASMMAAMMLPAVAPVASLYARTITSRRGRRLVLFVSGYIAVWALTALPAWSLLRGVDRVVGDRPTAMRAIAAGILVVAGVYQLSAFKARCLRHCRSPISQLMHYGNVTGRLPELRVAIHHGSFCLGCCWALMALFVTFGVMNVWAMLGLTALVVGEKMLRRGEQVGRTAGVVFLVLALLVVTADGVAQRVVPAADPMHMMG